MQVSDVQALLASAGYYRAAIDGDAGPKTMAAVEITERNAEADVAGWPDWRRLIAAGQRVLDAQGHEPGAADGYAGHNTAEALTAWRSAQAGTAAQVRRGALSTRPDPGDIPRQSQVAAYYGNPASGEVAPRLVYVELPFPLRIDWNLDQTTRRIRVHERAAPSLERALLAVHGHYGFDRMRDLGIDRYAGAYNHRRMRGGSAWSMHAYGCAIDFYAAPNALRMSCPRALFCGADYKPFLDTMEAHGWLPAIRLWGGDAMHFQRARL